MKNEADIYKALHDISDKLNRVGFRATVEGGGAAIPFVEIHGALFFYALILGDIGETWSADIYKTKEDYEVGESSGFIDLEIPSTHTDVNDIVATFIQKLNRYPRA